MNLIDHGENDPLEWVDDTPDETRAWLAPHR
jgi:hypothetical protein